MTATPRAHTAGGRRFAPVTPGNGAAGRRLAARAGFDPAIAAPPCARLPRLKSRFSPAPTKGPAMPSPSNSSLTPESFAGTLPESKLERLTAAALGLMGSGAEEITAEDLQRAGFSAGTVAEHGQAAIEAAVDRRALQRAHA